MDDIKHLMIKRWVLIAQCGIEMIAKNQGEKCTSKKCIYNFSGKCRFGIRHMGCYLKERDVRKFVELFG